MQRIADYDKKGYDYTSYWKDQGVARDYEDAAERIAIHSLLPTMHAGQYFLDLGGGFGRLTQEYAKKYDHLILADYSLENLKKAQTQGSANTYVALNAYHLPFRDNTLSGLQTIRMLHHIEAPDTVIGEIHRTLLPAGSAVIEYANKRHFLAVIRYVFDKLTAMLKLRGTSRLTKKTKINPFLLEPEDHSDLFYNFHPRWIEGVIVNNQLRIQKTLSVSNFRHQVFKKIFPVSFLLLLERVSQKILAPLRFAPSIFILASKPGSAQQSAISNQQLSSIFQCPACQNPDLAFTEVTVSCTKCDKTYPIVDGIYDFRV